MMMMSTRVTIQMKEGVLPEGAHRGGERDGPEVEVEAGQRDEPRAALNVDCLRLNQMVWHAVMRVDAWRGGRPFGDGAHRQVVEARRPKLVRKLPY